MGRGEGKGRALVKKYHETPGGGIVANS